MRNINRTKIIFIGKVNRRLVKVNIYNACCNVVHIPTRLGEHTCEHYNFFGFLVQIWIKRDMVCNNVKFRFTKQDSYEFWFYDFSMWNYCCRANTWMSAKVSSAVVLFRFRMTFLKCSSETFVGTKSLVIKESVLWLLQLSMEATGRKCIRSLHKHLHFHFHLLRYMAVS